MSTIETFRCIDTIKSAIIVPTDLDREICRLPRKPKAYLEAIARLADITTLGFAVRNGLINFESQNIFNQIDPQNGLVKLSRDHSNNMIRMLNIAHYYLLMDEIEHDKALAAENDALSIRRTTLSLICDLFPHVTSPDYIQEYQDYDDTKPRLPASDTLKKLAKIFSEPFNPHDIVSDYNAVCDDFDLYGINPVTTDVIWDMYCHQNGVVISRSPPSPNNLPISPRCAAPEN